MINNLHRQCSTCRSTKLLCDFYRHSNTRGGRMNCCKECHKRNVRENRACKVEFYREQDRKRREVLRVAKCVIQAGQL